MTGTLTEGRPQITDVVAAEGVTEAELLRVAAPVESLSDHPLAAAIAVGGRGKLAGAAVSAATDMRSIIGRRVQAMVESALVHISSPKLFGEVEGPALPAPLLEAVARMEGTGRTTMSFEPAKNIWVLLALWILRARPLPRR